MYDYFVAAREPRLDRAYERRVASHAAAMVIVGHHQQRHGHRSQFIHQCEQTPASGPGRGGHVVQRDAERGLLSHRRAPRRPRCPAARRAAVRTPAIDGGTHGPSYTAARRAGAQRVPLRRDRVGTRPRRPPRATRRPAAARAARTRRRATRAPPPPPLRSRAGRRPWPPAPRGRRAPDRPRARAHRSSRAGARAAMRSCTRAIRRPSASWCWRPWPAACPRSEWRRGRCPSCSTPSAGCSRGRGTARRSRRPSRPCTNAISPQWDALRACASSGCIAGTVCSAINCWRTNGCSPRGGSARAPRCAPVAEQPALCIALHDVAPATWPACRRLLALVDELGPVPVTLLVVPDYHHRGRVTGDPSFIRAIEARLARGDEVVVHGYHHLDEARNTASPLQWIKRHVYTQSEGEFAAIDEAEAHARLMRGWEMLAIELGWPVAGFVAPAWLLGRGAGAGDIAHRSAPG